MGEGLAGIQRNCGILKGGSRKQLGMTLIGISLLRMPSCFLHCRCSCKSKSCSFPLALSVCPTGWELEGSRQPLLPVSLVVPEEGRQLHRATTECPLGLKGSFVKDNHVRLFPCLTAGSCFLCACKIACPPTLSLWPA